MTPEQTLMGYHDPVTGEWVSLDFSVRKREAERAAVSAPADWKHVIVCEGCGCDVLKRCPSQVTCGKPRCKNIQHIRRQRERRRARGCKAYNKKPSHA
jgi:hypothetical protein